MKRNETGEAPRIPTIDFCALLRKREDDEDGKRKDMEEIAEACSQYGFSLQDPTSMSTLKTHLTSANSIQPLIS